MIRFHMPIYASWVIFFVFYLLIFWKRKPINTMVFIHVVFVVALFSGATNISDVYLTIDNINSDEVSKVIFDINIITIQNSIIPFLVLWSYQAWRIHQESTHIDLSYWGE